MTTKFHSDTQGSPDSMSADVQAALGAVRFPANKDAIVDAAKESGTSNEILSALNGLPERDYTSAQDVLQQWR